MFGRTGATPGTPRVLCLTGSPRGAGPAWQYDAQHENINFEIGSRYNRLQSRLAKMTGGA